MGQRLTHAPVFLTLAQVHFGPILALDSYVPRIQDELRRQGYPDFQKGMIATFNLNVAPSPEGAPLPQVPMSQAVRYNFSNIEKNAGFMLDQGSLLFQSTEYGDFDNFSAEFLKGLDIVNSVVGLSYTDRIGLRYLDAVFPREGEGLPAYLQSSVLGLFGRLEHATLGHVFCETKIDIDRVGVIARTVIQEGVLALPPDLFPLGVTVAERFRDKRGLHAILDTDGSTGRRDPFAIGRVADELHGVHKTVIDVFRATVTDHALASWA